MGLRRLFTAVLIAAVSIVFLGTPSSGDTSRFKASGCAENPHWEPKARTITTGDRIVWRNPTGCTHTVTAYGGGWSKTTSLSPGEGTRKRFRNAGKFKFRCTTPGHSVVEGGNCSGMCGQVRVTG